MKRIFLTAIGFACAYGIALAANPPSEVKKAFDFKFPKATNVKWEKENAKEWEASFLTNGEKVSANFSIDGSWVETEKSIKISELPKAVIQTEQKKFPGWKLVGAEKTETAKNGLIYETIITSGTHKKEIAFKENGTPVVE